MCDVVVAASLEQANGSLVAAVWSGHCHCTGFQRELKRLLPSRLALARCLHSSEQRRSLGGNDTATSLPSLNRVHPSPDLSRIHSPAGVSAFLVPHFIPETQPSDLQLQLQPAAALQLFSGCDPLPTPSLQARHSTFTMSKGVQQDSLIFDDDEEETCPLCVEEFDLTDKGFKPCPCGYQVCIPAQPTAISCYSTDK